MDLLNPFTFFFLSFFSSYLRASGQWPERASLLCVGGRRSGTGSAGVESGLIHLLFRELAF